MLELNRQTVINAGRRGDIPGMYRILGRYRFKKDAIDTYMSTHPKPSDGNATNGENSEKPKKRYKR